METTAIIVTANDLQQKIKNNEDIVLIDTLSPESFCAIHIPGSINIPANQVSKYVENVLPYKSQHLVIYCKSIWCRKSGRAIQLLKDLGYKKLSHFEGGLKEWVELGYKVAGSEEDLDDLC